MTLPLNLPLVFKPLTRHPLFLSWREQLQKESESSPSTFLHNPSNDSCVTPFSDLPEVNASVSVQPIETSEAPLTAADIGLLNVDQRRAFDIIAWHLDRSLEGYSPPLLRMIIYGEPGTGKSKVIQTISEYFRQRGASHLLSKNAYTGVAASLINGKTCHSAALLAHKNHTASDLTKAKLEQMWQDVKYNITDEFSMLGKTFLARFALNVGIGRGSGESDNREIPFGDTSVILTGDEHQLPPVACSIREALWYPPDPAKDSTLCLIGRSIFEEFTTVVILRQQMRITDPIWQDFLYHLRHGYLREHHIELLRRLVLSHPNVPHSNPLDPKWKDAVLITPRHAVRIEWNAHALRRHCTETKSTLIISHAHDSVASRELLPIERLAVMKRARGKTTQNDLPADIELAVGMRVMVTRNLDTELDITNGARGTLVDIIRHPDTEESSEDGVIHLSAPPAYLLVRLDRTRASKLKDLPAGIVPIEPIKKSFRVTIKQGKSHTRTISRTQLPLVAAYACTDYRAQGQTIQSAYIDIATPPSGRLSLFNLYVALSRCPNRDDFRLLRNFDEKLLLEPQCSELTEEDERLESLDRLTKTWWADMVTSSIPLSPFPF